MRDEMTLSGHTTTASACPSRNMRKRKRRNGQPDDREGLGG